MNAKSKFFVCLSIVIFALTFFFLPTEIPFHINSNGSVSKYCNKYVYFIGYVILDIVLSVLWNKFIDGYSKVKNSKQRDNIKFLISFAFFMALLIMLTSVFTTINTVWIGLICAIVYVGYYLLDR